MTEIIESHLTWRRGRPTEIAFFGGTFTALPAPVQRRCLDLAARYVDGHDLEGIRLSTRPDDLDADKMALLSKYPVVAVELGAQSMVDTVLEKNHRGHLATDVRRAVALLREAGIPVVLQLMLGLDGSDATTDLASVRAALALRPDGIRLYPTVVIAGTELAGRYERGDYRALGLEEAIKRTADALDLAEAAGIPCLRTGLPVEDLIASEAVVAGPVHRNFGQLVADERRIRELSKLLKPGEKRLVLRVPIDEVGDYTGYRRQIIRYFDERNITLVIQGDPGFKKGKVLKMEGGEQTCT